MHLTGIFGVVCSELALLELTLSILSKLGITPSTVYPKSSLASRTVLTDVSTASRISAVNIANNIPPIPPTAKFKSLRGATGSSATRPISII